MDKGLLCNRKYANIWFLFSFVVTIVTTMLVLIVERKQYVISLINIRLSLHIKMGLVHELFTIYVSRGSQFPLWSVGNYSQ